MDGTGTWRHRLLLIGRALFAGILWGAVFGALTWIVLGVVAALGEYGDSGDLLVALGLAPVAGLVGGGVGGTLGLTAGLALALSGPRVLQQLGRARVVTGSVVAAIPLAVALNLHRPRSSSDYAIAVGLAAVAAVTAVLLTPRILNGPPPPARWRRTIPPGTTPRARVQIPQQ
jgi:hypothetical protein